MSRITPDLKTLIVYSFICMLLSLLPTVIYEEYGIDDSAGIKVAKEYFLKHSDDMELKKMLRGEAFSSSKFKQADGPDDTLIENNVFFNYAKQKTYFVTWLPWFVLSIFFSVNSFLRILSFLSSAYLAYFIGYVNVTELITFSIAVVVGFQCVKNLDARSKIEK